MESTARISFSAITQIGTASTENDDRIYANGRFMHMTGTDCSRISLEASGRNFLFALSDGMDSGTSGISLTEDLKKLHEKTKSSSKDIQVKLDELADCIEQSNNLLYSISLGENAEKPKKPAFAGLIIDEGSIAAVNLGSCRIYKLDGDNFKLMVNDYKRTERLLKMGIINDEQAEMLSNQYKSTGADVRSSVRKSDIYALRKGTLYLLCSKGLTESVDEDMIYDILASGAETDVIADMLLKEAVGNETEDNVTVMVLKVDETGGDAVPANNVRSIPSRHISGKLNRLSRNVKKRRLDIARLATMMVVFVVIAAVIFGAFTFWLNLRGLKSKDTLGSNEPTTPTAVSTDETGPDTQDENTTGTTADTAGEATDTAGQTEVGNADAATNDAPAAGTSYKVKAGDSLMGISEKFYGDKSKYRLIMEANKITNPDKITAGQTLIIPAAK